MSTARHGRMEGWEVAVLRRSLAMADRPVDHDTLARILATLEELSHERAELQALLLAARGAPIPKLRRIIGQMRAILARE